MREGQGLHRNAPIIYYAHAFLPDDAMITRKLSNLIMYFESEALRKIERWLTIHGGSLGLAGRFTFDGGG